MEVIRRIFRQPNQDASQNDPQVQDELDVAEPPTDVASTQGPLIVSPTTARDLMSDLPDRSAEDAASIVNDLALNDVSKSSPKSTGRVRGKRKRQEADVMDGSPNKRVAKGRKTNGTEDEPPTTTNGITGFGSRPNSASSDVKEAPGKLPRPKREQRKRHMAQIYPAVQRSGDFWEPQPSPVKQVGKPASRSNTTTATNPQIPKATPRPRGRPTRMVQGRKTDMKSKPSRRGRPKGFVSPETESRENHETPMMNLPQKTPPKARPVSSRIKARGENENRAPNFKSTRSSAAASGHKDDILNAKTDLTKKPERDARRAAKQRRSLELVSVSTPPSARVSLVEERTRTRARNDRRRVRNGENLVQSRKKKNGSEGQKDVVGEFEVSPRLQDQVISEEREGEEDDDEDEIERERRKDSEEVIDSDGQTSIRSNEGEEEESAEAEGEDSDSEDPTLIIENDEEEDEGEEELELFGQDSSWKTILEGARSICGPKLPLNRMPKLLTEPMKTLINEVREARSVYEQLLPLRGTDRDSFDGLDDLLRERLDEIEAQIRSLSEKAATNKASEMIRDIYARAIPAMVFLLKSALTSRVYHSDEPCNLETLNETVSGLGEIVRLQKMAILLCEKATHWKAEPVPTSRPVVRPTTRKIFPYLRNMREVFSRTLVEQNKKRKAKQNAVDYSTRQKELAQSSQQAKQDAARKHETLLEMIRASREQEDETRRIGKRTLRQVKEDEARARMESNQVNAQIESRTTWSEAEDLALYFQLQKGYTGGLTSMFTRCHQSCYCSSLTTVAAEERYLNILNAPLLQNKLPEHIRERALYFKPTLLEEKGALEWITSIE